MSIQSFVQNFFGPDPFTKPNGTLTVNASKFLLQLWNRTGGGTGIVPKVSDNLISSGASIADALMLIADWNYIGTAAAGSGVQILPLKPGNDIWVLNKGAHTVNVYPPDGIEIDALGAGSPYALAQNKLRCFQCWTADQGQTTFFVTYGN